MPIAHERLVGLDAASHLAREPLRASRRSHHELGVQVRKPCLRAVKDSGLDQPGDHERHTHGIRGELPAQLLGEAHHGELRRAVHGHTRRWKEPACRRHVDDVSLVPLREVSSEDATSVEHPPKIDVDDALPLADRCFQQRTGLKHARVVDHDVACTVLRDRARQQMLHSIQAAHVGRDHAAASTERASLCSDQSHALFVAVGEDEVHARTGELQSERAPDPARRAGHHGNALIQVFHRREASLSGPIPAVVWLARTGEWPFQRPLYARNDWRFTSAGK